MNRHVQAIWILVVLTVLFAIPKETHATSTGGPTLPRQGGVEVGYEYDAMFNRRLEKPYGTLKTYDNFFTISVGFFDWVCFDGKIGVGSVTHTGSKYTPKLEYNSSFAGGYGLRIKVLDHDKTGIRVIAGAHHISVHPQDRWIGTDKYEACLDDWQGSVLAAKDFKYATPYVGIKGSDGEIVYILNYHLQKRRYSQNHVGLVCGSDFLLFNKSVKINVEGRFFDETAMSAGIVYRF